MATQIGLIKAIVGEVTATSADGGVRTLQVGDRIFANDLISTGPGGAVEIEFTDGSVMDLGRDSQALLDNSIFNPDAAATAELGEEAVPDDIAAIQQALLEGEDPTQVGEATAAGAGVDAGNEGHEAVFVDYLNPAVTPDAGFDTIGVFNEYDLPEEDIIILEEEESLPVVSVSVDVEIDIEDPQTPPPDDGVPTPEHPVIVSGNAASVLEGTGEGTRTVTFIIKLSNPFPQDVDVTYALVPVSDNGAADNPDDWFDGPSPQTVTIPAGSTDFPVEVEIVEDHFDEGNGVFEIVLINATNATINPDADSAMVTIYDDDTTPVAQDDFNSVTEDGFGEDELISTTGNVISGTNDAGNDPADQEDTDEDGDVLEIVSFSDNDDEIDAAPGDEITGQYGTLTMDIDGNYTYVLTANDDPAIQGLSEGETLTDVFSYVVTDTYNTPQMATLTIVIEGADDGVTITGLDGEGAEEVVYEEDLSEGSSPDAGALTQDGSFSFDAPDGFGDTGSVSVGGQGFTLAQLQALAGSNVTISSAYGDLTLTDYTGDEFGGTISYEYMLTANVDNDSQVDADDFGYTDSFEVVVTDDDGSDDTASLDILIVDDEPTANDDGPAQTEEDIAVVIAVDGNDVEGADGVDFTDGTKVFVSSAAANGGVVYNNDGTFTYTPNEGFFGQDSFEYTITDEDGDTDTATVNINVVEDSEPVVSVTNTAVDETGGLDSTDGTLTVDFGTDTGAVALSAANATWDGANTLNADNGTWKIVVNNNGTYTFTQLLPMVHSGGEDASLILNITATATDSDGDIVNEPFTVTVYDDGPVVTDYDGIINIDAASSLEVLDYDLGLDGLGSVSFSLAGSSVPLTSGGQAVLTESVDLGDGREQLVGYLESGDNAGYQEGEDGVVFTIAPQSPDAEPDDGTYELSLSSDNVLDLPQSTVSVSFAGITAGGPIDSVDTVGGEITISVVPGNEVPDDVNASNGYVGIDNNSMNDGESIQYLFNATLVNDLQLDIFNTGPAGETVTWTTFNSADPDNTMDTGQITISGDGLSPAITADFDFDTIQFTVSGGAFKVGGVTYTDTGDPQDILVQFDYQGQDSDGDAVNGSIDVTVTAIDPTVQTGSDILSHPDSQVDPS